MMKKFFAFLATFALLFMTVSCFEEWGDSNEIPEGAVDLGLSVYWASSNLSATGLCKNPEDYGDHYAWGETEPKGKYDWSTYKWCSGQATSLTKYNSDSDWGTVDNKKVLEANDDAAHVALGGNWRMPTYEEWTELVKNCTWTWTTLNGVNGYEVKAANGNSIFLPAAGWREYSNLNYAGNSGSYWTSSLSEVHRGYACYVYISPSGTFLSDSARLEGLSIRPVAK